MREWIVTNGLGSYASLTYANTNTRKFHGLLVASLDPPTNRWVFVSNVFEKIQIKDKTYDLRDVKGRFLFDLFPSFIYHIDNVTIKKTIFMEYGKNTTLVRYKITTHTPISCVYHPVINSRHFYDVMSRRDLSLKQDIYGNGLRIVSIKPSNIDKTLKLMLQDASYESNEYWEDMYYDTDRERRDSWRDNNIHIGDFHKTVQNSSEYYLILTLEDDPYKNPVEIYEREKQRKQQLLELVHLPNKFNKLVISTDNFVVKKGTKKSIVAGYHWFSDWGRDTLISLPGITLVTRRFDDARQILLSFSEYSKHGLIPNTFMDRDAKVVYNTVDASLWYIDCVYQYLKYTNDRNFLKEIWGTLESIIHGYKNGTENDIHMDHDFLISHGEGLTWMDVKIGDYYPTPRAKKAVEIQALWYNALRIMSTLAPLVSKEDVYASLAVKVKDSFNRQYDRQYDVIDTKDTSVRPNQIFLVSLDFSMIEQHLQEKIVNDVQGKLFTPFGLRTLSPDDPNYKGRYIGDYNKDMAYHNGTVWPWLLGSFIKAFVKVKNHEHVWRKFAFQHFLKPMFDVIADDWDGSIYEIFDGDPPYLPQGCITQAWSVAEILRAWVEDIENISPPFEHPFSR